jgi:hypothetical protein
MARPSMGDSAMRTTISGTQSASGLLDNLTATGLIHCSQSLKKVASNSFGLGEEADFEALNCQPSTKFDTRQNV